MGLEALLDENSEVERLAGGFGFTEGPVWNPDGYLLFSDLGGDVRYRWDPQDGVTEAMRPSNKCNGMTYDADGNLLVCEHVTSSLVRERPDGTRETLASHYDGAELNSPNDVVVRSDGSIYFTDPWYGRQARHGLERPCRLGFQGVYRIPADGGALELLADDYEQPNGLCFSPDESLLYVDDTARAHIRIYDVREDGRVANDRTFFAGVGTAAAGEGAVDGMKCDEHGNVWVTGPGGIWVIGSGAEHLGVLEVPEITANLTWGGPDRRTLFVAASTSIYAVRTGVGPAHVR